MAAAPPGNGLYLPEEEELTNVPLTSPDRRPPSAPTSAPPDRGKPSLLRRPCYYLASFVKALPVIFISCTIGWSYYAYMAAVVLTTMADHPAEQVVCAVVFHCLVVMFVWSYAMVVLTPPGSVPASWRLGPEQVQLLGAATSEEEWKRTLANLADELHCQVKQRSVQAAVRYCERCLAIKPDRSHHCSVCQDCTLKMDHHCPWVNNCVGFGNYKFFLLFLGYAICYCLWIAGSTVRFVVRIWLHSTPEEVEVMDGAKWHASIVFIVSLLFTLSISSLFWYHLWLLMHNRSTLEQFRAPMFENNKSDQDGWSLGRMNNMREVLGPSLWLWPVPVSTVMGDGLMFPTRVHLPGDCTTYHSIGRDSLPSRAETPSRTLINPTIGKDGQVVVGSSLPTTVATSPDCRLTITPDSGVGETEVRLDHNGQTHTVMVPEGETAPGLGR